MFEIRGKFNKAKVFATTVEESCKDQIKQMCNQQWLEECNIAIMPDCHTGAGCTIGTTVKLKNKVSPSMVGVDISCGMLVIEIPNELELHLDKIDEFITNHIPAGFDVNDIIQYNDLFLSKMLCSLHCYEKLENVDRIKKSLGSLGSGNHFIEIDKDDEDNHYLVIHSGSRNLGKQVAEIYQNIADEYCNGTKKEYEEKKKELIETLKKEGKQKEIQKALEKFSESYKGTKNIPHELCYLEGQDMQNYLEDTLICNEYAKNSRVSMAKRILAFIVKDNMSNLSKEDKDSLNFWIDECQENLFEFGYNCDNFEKRSYGFQTLHNYIGTDKILRKGAISMKENEKVIIPINMRDGSIIAIGKGNSNYNFSGPHGAGRLMGRKEAKEKLNMENFKETMKNIYSTSVVSETLDEAPMAYKNIEEILENIKDTATVVKIIKPIYNFKAHKKEEHDF